MLQDNTALYYSITIKWRWPFRKSFTVNCTFMFVDYSLLSVYL